MRTKKQARLGKQNLQSGDTDSYENMTKFGKLANGGNPNSNKNPKISRDYDKDQLILCDYSRFMLGLFDY